jgi:flagellar protein FlgJ
MNELPSASTAAIAPTPEVRKTLTASARSDPNALRKQAVEFEAVYLTQMLQPMFDNLKSAEPFDGGFGEGVWRSLQVQEYGKALAKSGGVGIADAVARQLLQAQEEREGVQR